jgi:hypothetical protein
MNGVIMALFFYAAGMYWLELKRHLSIAMKAKTQKAANYRGSNPHGAARRGGGRRRYRKPNFRGRAGEPWGIPPVYKTAS